MNHYLSEYREILKNIDKINSTLDKEESIEAINVHEEIVSCVNSFKEIKKIDRFSLNQEEIEEIDKKNDEIKELIIKLKNKEIHKYNLQVEKLNKKIKLLKSVSSLMNEEEVRELEIIKYCNAYISSDWKRNNYIHLLNYDKLVDVVNKLSYIEKKYNVKNNEPIDLGVKINYFVQLFEDVKKEIKDDISLVETKELLDKTMDIYGNIIDLDITSRMYYENGDISKETYSKFNHDTTKLSNESCEFILNLLSIKRDVDDRSNDYTVVLDKLDIVELQLNKLNESIEKNYGKCSSAILNRYKVYLEKIDLILSSIEKETNSIELNSEQKRRLFGKNGRFEKVNNLFEDFCSKLNDDPYILGDNLDNYLDELMIEVEKDINTLNSIVNLLEKPVRNEKKKEKVEFLVSKIKTNIKHIQILMSKSGKNYLKNDLKHQEEIFENVCRTYNGKCPLLVKKVKPASSVYKKYKKECLEISGLSSFSLLNNPVLIPTIMHGNEVLQQRIPSLKSFTNFVNNVLGGVINARRNENGEWLLSNGYKIGPTVACTSLLKNMALSNSKLVSASHIQNIKNLMTKMQIKRNKEVSKKGKYEVNKDVEIKGRGRR